MGLRVLENATLLNQSMFNSFADLESLYNS